MADGFNNAAGPQAREKRPDAVAALGILAVALLAGLQAATQYFAYLFQYQVALGFELNRIYPPWGIVAWWAKWYRAYPGYFLGAGSVGIAFIGCGVGLIAYRNHAWRARAQRFIHGSARWANRRDLTRAGLLPRTSLVNWIVGKQLVPPPGVYVGGWLDERGQFNYLRHSGSQHVGCSGPTRCGKGVGLVLTNLLSWPGSVLVLDLKDELHRLTWAWRHLYAKNVVLRFEPAVKESLGWNPLDEIPLGDREVGEVQSFARVFIDPNPEEIRKNHWKVTAKMLLDAMILHVLYRREREGKVASLGAIEDLLSDPTRPSSDLWEEMMAYRHYPDGRTHTMVAKGARDMVERPEEERGSVLSSLKTALELWRDPVVAANTARSDFKIRDLMHCDEPRSLYVVTQPNDEDRLRPVTRVLLHLITQRLMENIGFEKGRPKPNYKHRLWCFFDEVPQFGRLVFLEKALAIAATYGIHFYLFWQDRHQLKAVYGEHEAITANLHIQIAYPPNDMETAEYYSRLIGETTVRVEQVSTSTTVGRVTVNRVRQYVKRRLLDAGEVHTMQGPVMSDDGLRIVEPGDILVFASGRPATFGRAPAFFLSPELAARAAVTPPILPPRNQVQIRL